MNIILTGPKHCGKSTAIAKILKLLDGSVSGFITQFDDRASDERKLYIKSLDGTESRCAARWYDGRIEVDKAAFDSFSVSLIDPKCDNVVIDELGKFEKNSKALRLAVRSAFDSEANVIVSIRLDAEGWMQALKSRDDAIVFTVDDLNRDVLPGRVLELINT